MSQNVLFDRFCNSNCTVQYYIERIYGFSLLLISFEDSQNIPCLLLKRRGVVNNLCISLVQVYHMTGEGEDGGVVYCEMQGTENTGETKTHLQMIRYSLVFLLFL
jgi:hypothetical protein